MYVVKKVVFLLKTCFTTSVEPESKPFASHRSSELVTHLPTIMSSHSDAWDLKLFHRSMVKMVLELLKMDVSEDIRAAIITAIIRPRSPGQDNTVGISGSRDY